MPPGGLLGDDAKQSEFSRRAEECGTREIDAVVKELVKEMDQHRQKMMAWLEPLRHCNIVQAPQPLSSMAASVPSQRTLPSLETPSLGRFPYLPGTLPDPSDRQFTQSMISPASKVNAVIAGSLCIDAACENNVCGEDALETKDTFSADADVEASMELAASSKTRKQNAGKNKNKLKTKLLVSADDEEEEKNFLQRITENQQYEVYSAVLILCNSAFIGWQTQAIAARAWSDAENDRPLEASLPPYFLVLQTLFAVAFFADLFMRWIAAGLLDFCWRSHELGWNWLDIVVVFLGTVDTLTELVTLASQQEKSDSFMSNFSVLKVLRVVRIVRIAKVIRTMKFFRELRMMIFSILGCSKSLCWVFLVLSLVFYIFAITFTSAVTSYLTDKDMWNAEQNAYLRQSFGTLDRSIMSLYMAMSGGSDWGPYFEACAKMGPVYQFLYLIFITFMIFAVVNIVTGVFVDSAMQANLADKDIVVAEEMESRKQYLDDIREIFQAMDDDGSGAISLDELETGLANDRLKAYFHSMKLDVSDAKTLFQLLDTSGDAGDNVVNIDEFVEGCWKLQGEATSLEAKKTQIEVEKMRKLVVDLSTDMKKLMAKNQC